MTYQEFVLETFTEDQLAMGVELEEVKEVIEAVNFDKIEAFLLREGYELAMEFELQYGEEVVTADKKELIVELYVEACNKVKSGVMSTHEQIELIQESFYKLLVEKKLEISIEEFNEFECSHQGSYIINPLYNYMYDTNVAGK